MQIWDLKQWRKSCTSEYQSIHLFFYSLRSPSQLLSGKRGGTPQRSHRFITGLTEGALPPQELYLLRNSMHFSAGTQSLNWHWGSFTLNKVPAWKSVLFKGPGIFRRGWGAGELGSEYILWHRKRHHIIKTKEYLRTLLDVYVHLEALAPHSWQSPNKSSDPICIIFPGLRQRWKQRQQWTTAATSKLLLENQPAATKTSFLLLVGKCQ